MRTIPDFLGSLLSNLTFMFLNPSLNLSLSHRSMSIDLCLSASFFLRPLGGAVNNPVQMSKINLKTHPFLESTKTRS